MGHSKMLLRREKDPSESTRDFRSLPTGDAKRDVVKDGGVSHCSKERSCGGKMIQRSTAAKSTNYARTAPHVC
jgi:hypothetical protein